MKLFYYIRRYVDDGGAIICGILDSGINEEQAKNTIDGFNRHYGTVYRFDLIHETCVIKLCQKFHLEMPNKDGRLCRYVIWDKYDIITYLKAR